jgi:hypothetical protein
MTHRGNGAAGGSNAAIRSTQPKASKKDDRNASTLDSTPDNSRAAVRWRVERARPIVARWERHSDRFFSEILEDDPAKLHRIADARGRAIVDALPPSVTMGLTYRERKDLETVVGGISISKLLRLRDLERKELAR